MRGAAEFSERWNVNFVKRLGLSENALVSAWVQQVTKAAARGGRAWPRPCCAAGFVGSLEQVGTVSLLLSRL